MDDCLVCTVEIPPCVPDSHPYKITSTKCHIDTVVSPDDGHIIARNMHRKENKNCAPSWLHLQDVNSVFSNII